MITVILPLYYCYITVILPLCYRYITFILPLYITVILPLYYCYITVILPLYITIILPLYYRYITVILLLYYILAKMGNVSQLELDQSCVRNGVLHITINMQHAHMKWSWVVSKSYSSALSWYLFLRLWNITTVCVKAFLKRSPRRGA